MRVPVAKPGFAMNHPAPRVSPGPMATSPDAVPALLAVAKIQIRDLHPAYFAMVRTPGIVATACHLTGMPLVGKVLAWFNYAAYAVLAAMLAARIVFYSRFFYDNLMDHQCGVGFFTVVAGTAVLGSQSVILFGLHRWGKVLWIR